MEDLKMAGVILLFNPNLPEVLRNISTYIDYCDKLYVLDNTPNPVTIVEKQLFSRFSNKIVYQAFSRNYGVAKALNVGFSLAKESGAKWMLTMDQDSMFPDDCFFEVFKTIDKSSLGIISPEATSNIPKTTIDIRFKTMDAVITSGNIVSVHAWETIKGYEEDYFIDDVDTEFCFKMNLSGFQVLLVQGAFLIHFIGNEKEKRYFFSKKRIQLHDPLRLYYIVRNGLYLKKKYKKNFPIHLKLCKQTIKKRIRHNIISGDSKFKSLYYIFVAYRDYLMNKRGAIKD